MVFKKRMRIGIPTLLDEKNFHEKYNLKVIVYKILSSLSFSHSYTFPVTQW